MIASRLWYIVLSLVIGFLSFQLYIASSHFDRASQRSMREGLNGDAQVVSWYLRDDARKRSSALMQPLSRCAAGAPAHGRRAARRDR